jgi:hypothetical protein
MWVHKGVISRCGVCLLVFLIGGCGSAAPDCGPDNCTGCCRDGVCEAGTVTEACGSNGDLCDVCVGAQVCNGRCELGTGGGTGAGGGTSSGGGTASGGGAATGGGTGTGGGGGPCTTDTWSTYGSTFFSGNCSRCHGSAFSSHATVQSEAGLLSSYIGGGAMPPGGLSSTPRNRAVTYLNCGAP